MYKIILLSLLSVLPISQSFATNTKDVDSFNKQIRAGMEADASKATSKMFDNYEGKSTSSGGSGANVPNVSISADIKEDVNAAGAKAGSKIFDTF